MRRGASTQAMVAALGFAYACSGGGTPPDAPLELEERHRCEWEWHLERTDHHLVQKAIRLGCEGVCSGRLEAAFARRRAERRRYMQEEREGRITRERMIRRAIQAAEELDEAVSVILSPDQQAGLDGDAARFQVAMEASRGGSPCEREQAASQNRNVPLGER